MTFKTPAFSIFRVNTFNLDTKYSTLLGLYKVVSSTSLVQQTSLEVLIARTNDVIKCKTERETQRDVFNLLANELRQIPKEDEEKIKQGTFFLLGALIHRYFRLIKEYDDYNSYNFFTRWSIWSPCKVKNCKLFLAIRKALQFKDIKEVEETYEVDDLEILDAVTIVTALETFRNNMFLEDDKTKTPRYMKYPHFAQDKNFKENLDVIIEAQTKRAAPFLRCFQAIAFIKSLVKEIEKERKQLEKDIEKWCKGVAKEYRVFADFEELDESAINASLLKYVESETSRNIILYIFNTSFIQDNLKSTDHSTLITKMKEGNDSACSHTLLGGYVLLLQQSETLDHDLLFAIQLALGLEKSLDEITKESMLNGVKFLIKFFSSEPRTLDYEFFGGKEKMETALARAERALTLITSKESETTSALSA